MKPVILNCRRDLNLALQNIKEARNMLIAWKDSYQKTRTEIEVSGLHNRWEFNQKLLFNDTNYIIKICEDLYKIIDIKLDFYNIFGNDLQSITTVRSASSLMMQNVDEKLIKPIKV